MSTANQTAPDAETNSDNRAGNGVDDRPLVRRFQRSRWSRTRRRMEAMEPGDVLKLPLSEYYNAHSSALRLSDAYSDRQWKASRRGPTLTVFCDAQNPVVSGVRSTSSAKARA